MARGVVLALVVVVVSLGFVGGAAMPSGARSQQAAATPAVDEMPPCAADEAEVDVRPANPADAAVTLVSVEATPGQTPTIVYDDRELYLVVVTLEPDGCVGYDALANQKDGALVWIVQQGEVAFAWKELTVIPGATPVITRGDLAGNRVDISAAPGTVQTLYPGDWVTQDRQIMVSIRNVGSDSAIILKAVYAFPEVLRCPGDCR